MRLYYFIPERGLFLAARAAGARSAPSAAWTSFESFFADELGEDGHFGLANSIRHCGPPEKSDVSAATNAGASPPRDPDVRVGRELAEHRGDHAGQARTCTFTT